MNRMTKIVLALVLALGMILPAAIVSAQISEDITIHKVILGGGPAETFTFEAWRDFNNNGVIDAQPGLEDVLKGQASLVGAGTVIINVDIWGQYIIREKLQDGSVYPQPPNQVLGVTGHHEDLTFYNESGIPELGCLDVIKTVDWGETTADTTKTFEICISGPSYPNGDCKTVDYDGGTASWIDLIPGVYTVTETDPGADWTVTPGLVQTVTVNTESPCESVTFDNTLERGCLDVIKTVNWGEATPDITKTFEICISGPSYPNGDCKTVDYDGGTASWIDLIPGVYTVTETDPGADWTVTPGLVQTVTVNTESPCESVTFDNTNEYSPTCNSACAAQGPSETDCCVHLFNTSDWFTYIVYNEDGIFGTADDSNDINNPRMYPIFTGATTFCGWLEVYHEGGTLHVRYNAAEGFIGFSAYHLEVVDEFPHFIKGSGYSNLLNKQLHASPGQAEYGDDVDADGWIHCVDDDISGYGNVYIFAHSLICR